MPIDEVFAHPNRVSDTDVSQYLLGKAPVIAWAKDLEGRYLYVNDTCLSVCGLTREQVVGRTDEELFDPSFAAEFVKNDREVIRLGQTLRTEERAPVEGQLISHSTKFPLVDEHGKTFAVGGIAIDITERYLTEKRLEESESRYRELIEHSPEAFFVFDVESRRFVDANENTERLFGLSREKLLETSPTELSPPFQPDGRRSEEASWAYIQSALEGNTPVFDWVHQAGSGELLPCRIWLARVTLPTGPGVRASLLDMREIERVRSNLATTRAQLDAVQDALPQMIVVYDSANQVMSHCNRTYRSVHFEEPLWDLARDACQRCIASRDAARQEVTAITLDQKRLILEVDVSVFERDDSGRPLRLLLVASDVTEQREKDTLLRDTQRLESLGRLAGGVAHDFNNLLTVILGAAELLEISFGEHAEAQRDLDDLIGAADRARDLTTQLLTFARSHTETGESVPIDGRINESMGLLRRLVGEDIELKAELWAAGAYVSMDPGQLEQILVNLVANARDAMKSHGKIVVATREAAPESVPGSTPTGEVSFVELSVSDTGVGMTAEVADRAIDPFFTTKEVGRGTGLGLSTVHGIVRNAGGRMHFETRPGSGTRVVIRLPARPKTRASTLPPLSSSGEPIKARILLVEDEEAVRHINERGLQRAGHQVLSARDGPHALSVLEDGLDVDIVVTDVVMPKMSGFELADRVHEFLPDLPFIFVSGYAEGALADRGLARSQVAIVQKPFVPRELSEHIACALGNAKSVP